jgi:hypothetical protein
MSERHQTLKAILRVLAVILLLRVLVVILSNYPDYFPPNFDSLFLEGRETTFVRTYRAAFYVHILTGPVVLLNGMLLLSEVIRLRYRAWHRTLGRIQVSLLLLLLLPTSVVMSGHAFGGWPAGLSFVLLSLATAFCAILGVVHACCRRYPQHRRWMWRSYILICSAVVLRLLSGAASLLEPSSPEIAYIIAAWTSWLMPLAVYELFEHLRKAEDKTPTGHPGNPARAAVYPLQCSPRVFDSDGPSSSQEPSNLIHQRRDR